MVIYDVGTYTLHNYNYKESYDLIEKTIERYEEYRSNDFPYNDLSRKRFLNWNVLEEKVLSIIESWIIAYTDRINYTKVMIRQAQLYSEPQMEAYLISLNVVNQNNLTYLKNYIYSPI